MIFNEAYQLKARARLAAAQETIKQIQSTAEEAGQWLPGRLLATECRTAVDLMEKMEERLVQKLVVTLVGPSGAGKSTLLNALAGEDTLSPPGVDRPTTRRVIVFCHFRTDAEVLLQGLGPDAVEVVSRPGAAGLEQVVLVDTPDMDSMEGKQFHPLLEQTIALTDVLICVLNAENPKRRDTLVFFKRFVDLFPGISLNVVLNRCDRLSEEELKTVILPDLENHLRASWRKPVDRILCLSARSHLIHPDWPEGEKPRHSFDQYSQLHQLIFGTLHQEGVFMDLRLERVEHLTSLVAQSVRESLSGVQEEVRAIRKDILELEQKATLAATAALRESGAEMLSGIQALFYQKVADRWWGPVGWLVALWARFLMAGAGVLATLRLGNPVLQLWGLISSLVRYRQTRRRVEEATAGEDMASVLLAYRLTIQQAWPDLAEKLIALGFNPGVRDSKTVLQDEEDLHQRLVASWKNALEEEMNRRINGISGFMLQLLFNLPTLAIMGLFAYQSVKSFLWQHILATGYFLHAAVSIVMVGLLSFFLLQILIRFVGGWNLLKPAAKRLVGLVETTAGSGHHFLILNQIDAVLRLGYLVRK